MTTIQQIEALDNFKIEYCNKIESFIKQFCKEYDLELIETDKDISIFKNNSIIISDAFYSNLHYSYFKEELDFYHKDESLIDRKIEIYARFTKAIKKTIENNGQLKYIVLENDKEVMKFITIK